MGSLLGLLEPLEALTRARLLKCQKPTDVGIHQLTEYIKFMKNYNTLTEYLFVGSTSIIALNKL